MLLLLFGPGCELESIVNVPEKAELPRTFLMRFFFHKEHISINHFHLQEIVNLSKYLNCQICVLLHTIQNIFIFKKFTNARIFNDDSINVLENQKAR